MILVAAILMWTLYEFRRVVICTDSLWNQAYLESEKRELQLRINLWNRFYLPEKKVLPLEEASQEAFEARCGVNNRAVYLLSPYLSSILNPQRLLQASPHARFVFWETALPGKNSLSDFMSNLQNYGGQPRIFLLYIDHSELADAFAAALMPLVSSDSADGQNLEDTQARRTVQLYYSSSGAFRHTEMRAVKSKLEEEIAGIRVRLVDMAAAEIASEDIVLLAGGAGTELQPLLTKIQNRGARAVVYGDGALGGWPEGVEAEISIDLEASLMEVLERQPRLTADDGEYGKIATQNPAVQRFAVRFKITR